MACSVSLWVAALVLGTMQIFALASFERLSLVDSDFHRARTMDEQNIKAIGNMSSEVLNASENKVLSRAKRYVIFPKGSSLQLVYCASLHGYVPLTTIFVVGLTMGIAWMLPSETRQLYLQRRDTSQHPDREHRLKLFQDMSTFLNSRGLKGQHCVLRTICESTQPNIQQKGNFMEELFRQFFTLPVTSISQDSDWDQARYNGTSCSVRYPLCTTIMDLPLKPIK